MTDGIGIDCHVHVSRCGHAEGTVDRYVDAALAAGLDTIAFTDHLPFPGGAEAGYCMPEADLVDYVADVDALRGRSSDGIRVLLGVEADWLPGVEQRLGRLEDAGLDVVLGSVHILDGWAFDDPDQVARYDTVDVYALWERYYEETARAAESGLFDVMAHPDLVKKFGYVPDRDVRPLYEMAARAFARSGVALEVNTAGLRKPCAEIYPSLDLLTACRASGVPATVGSDAHRPDEVGFGGREAVDLLKQAGYDRVVYFQGREPSERRL